MNLQKLNNSIDINPFMLLTPTEKKVADSLAQIGLSKKETANKLNVSYSTIDTHTRSIYKKFNVNKISEFVRTYLIKKYNLPQLTLVFYLLVSSIWQSLLMDDPERAFKARRSKRGRRDGEIEWIIDYED